MAATSVKKVENKTARRGFLKWAKSRKGQQTLIILAFTIIPLVLLASGDRDHILSGVFNQFLSAKPESVE